MKFINFSIALLLLTGGLHAQNRLTVEGAVQLALKNNLGIKIAKNNAEVSKNNAHIGNAGLLPRIDLAAEATYSDNNIKTSTGEVETKSTLTTAGIAASYTLFDGFANINTYKKFKALGLTGELSARLTIENTLLQVISAYYNAAATWESKQTAGEALDISRERYERVKYKNDFGNINKIDLLNAEVDLKSDSISYFNAILYYGEALRNLNTILNQEVETELELDADVVFLENMDYNELKQSALTSNSSYLLSLNSLRISELDNSIASGGFFPQLNLSAAYGLNQTGPNFNTKLNDPNTSLSAGLSLKYNIFDGFRTSIKKQNAQISVENSKLDLENQKKLLEQDIANAYNNYTNELFVMKVEERKSETARLNFTRTKELYNLGQVTTTRFREAQLNLFNARNNLSRAKYSAKIAEAKLLKLSGKLVN